MASLSSSLEVCGSTETLVGNTSNKELEDTEMVGNSSNKELEDTEMKIEAVSGMCSIDDIYQKTGAPRLEIPGSDKNACGSDTLTEDQQYVEEIRELNAYLDMVETIARPACAPEVLKMALNSMSTLFNTLTFLSATRLHASL